MMNSAIKLFCLINKKLSIVNKLVKKKIVRVENTSKANWDWCLFDYFCERIVHDDGWNQTEDDFVVGISRDEREENDEGINAVHEGCDSQYFALDVSCWVVGKKGGFDGKRGDKHDTCKEHSDISTLNDIDSVKYHLQQQKVTSDRQVFMINVTISEALRPEEHS